MTATEQWIFLCAAHKTPKECPAIDYTRHTLDGAACLLNSNKYFPSRVSIKVNPLFHDQFGFSIDLAVKKILFAADKLFLTQHFYLILFYFFQEI